MLTILALLFAAAVTPHVIEDRNRARQKRTMASMREIATAWESRATEINSYRVGRARDRVTPDDLAHVLVPTYMRHFPGIDAWGTELQFVLAGGGQQYTIRSLGSDGRADPVADLAGPTTDFRDDIVYANGSFVRYPEESG